MVLPVCWFGSLAGIIIYNYFLLDVTYLTCPKFVICAQDKFYWYTCKAVLSTSIVVQIWTFFVHLILYLIQDEYIIILDFQKWFVVDGQYRGGIVG